MVGIMGLWSVALLLSQSMLIVTSVFATQVPENKAEAELALGIDELCDADVSDSACALNALQMNSQRVAGEYLEAGMEAGSCKVYGCTKFNPSHDCQCNAKCVEYGNCCQDHSSVCHEASDVASCKSYGCGVYVETQACQCNDKCSAHGNCCSDYAATCPASGSCHAYGCGKYDKSQSCQCNDKCTKYGNCCADFANTCTGGAHDSCHAYGCGKYNKSQACQCTDKCATYGNCCSDYSSTCGHGGGGGGHGSCRAYGCGKYDESRSCQCNDRCEKYGNCCTDYSSTCAAHHPPGTHPVHHPGKIYGHPSASKRYPSYPGFSLTLVEEFDSPIDLDSDPIWTWSDGGLIEGQIRYVKEAIKFHGGKMHIEVSKKPPHHYQACSHAESTKIPPKTLSSGEMRTKHNMFRYGRYEASIRAPTVQPGNTKINGNYVATMFTFRDGKYKHWREIDIEITGDNVDSLHTNVLSADETPEWNADMGEEKDTLVGTNVRSQFHTYAIEWLPHKITWFFDGKVIRQKTGGKIPIPSMSTKIMMNTWVFDERAMFGGKHIENDHFPLHAEYDWFRFYKWDGETHYPCAGMGTHCLTPDDRYLSSNNPCDGIPLEGTVYGKPSCVASCR